MADHIARIDSSRAPELVELWKRTFRQAYSDMHSADNIERCCAANFTVANALDVLEDNNTVCKIYYRDEEPIGFCIVVHHECPFPLTGKSSELKQIYILADTYGSGVGREMLADAYELVRSANGKWIWLAVADLNHRAQSFYDKTGFHRVGPGPIFDVGTDRLTSTIMARNIQIERTLC